MANLKLPYDLLAIAKAFDIQEKSESEALNVWISGGENLVWQEDELRMLHNIHKDLSEYADNMNEEELKVRMLSPLFYLANIEVPQKVRVFYERPLSATIKGYQLSVIVDCVVATPLMKMPYHPYFFLQELKKGKGEKKDPEAQMLMAMLIAQHLNPNPNPVYGAYLIGTSWRFATLSANDYCLSRKFEATHWDDLLAVLKIMANLKNLIINR